VLFLKLFFIFFIIFRILFSHCWFTADDFSVVKICWKYNLVSKENCRRYYGKNGKFTGQILLILWIEPKMKSIFLDSSFILAITTGEFFVQCVGTFWCQHIFSKYGKLSIGHKKLRILMTLIFRFSLLCWCLL
jgi:hypothetical protein